MQWRVIALDKGRGSFSQAQHALIEVQHRLGIILLIANINPLDVIWIDREPGGYALWAKTCISRCTPLHGSSATIAAVICGKREHFLWHHPICNLPVVKPNGWRIAKKADVGKL